MAPAVPCIEYSILYQSPNHLNIASQNMQTKGLWTLTTTQMKLWNISINAIGVCFGWLFYQLLNTLLGVFGSKVMRQKDYIS